MKKIVNSIAAVLIGMVFLCAVACGEATSESSSSVEVTQVGVETVSDNQILVSGMNTYNEITNWTLDENTSVKVNREEAYVKDGAASTKISFARIAGSSMLRYEFGPNIPKIDATKLTAASVWIYNANSVDIDFIFGGADAAKRILFADKTTLLAGEWTEVSIAINQYQMQVLNPAFTRFIFQFIFEDINEATVYVDSLKVDIAADSVGAIEKTNFETGEILKFNTIEDLVWTMPNSRNSYGGIITVPLYQYAVTAPLSQSGGALKIDVQNRGAIKESTLIWNGGFSMVDKTGFKIPQRMLENIDFSATTSLSVDVYHDYINARMITLMIMDELGLTIQTDVWVNPGEWTTLTLTDFGALNFNRIASIEFYYADYMTLESYSIYVDNLVYAKGV